MNRRTTRTAVSALAVLGLALGLGACSEAAEKAADQVDKSVGESYEVTYEVTGKGIESIDYHAGDGTAMAPEIVSEKKPTTPWKKTVKLKGIMPCGRHAGLPQPRRPHLQGHLPGQGHQGGQGRAGDGRSGCVAVSPVVG